MYGLGRLPSEDENDKRFLLRSVVFPLEEIERRYRYWWTYSYKLDQGNTPQCVEYAWHHWLVDGPTKQHAPPLWPYGEVYHAAQQVDEWEGDDYDGTSVRAGAKVLQSRGYISQYLWAWDIDTIVSTLLTIGPIVVGTNWYESMFYPTGKTGILDVTGGIAGGHAYELTGVSLNTGLIRGKNSWGPAWGNRGNFFIRIPDMARLISEDGEACLATEVAPI